MTEVNIMEINSIYDCFTADKDINRVDGLLH